MGVYTHPQATSQYEEWIQSRYQGVYDPITFQRMIRILKKLVHWIPHEKLGGVTSQTTCQMSSVAALF